MAHTTVLLREAVDALEIEKDDVIVDATLGSAGHAKEICKRLDGTGTLIGIDADQEALDRSLKLLERTKCRVEYVLGNFSDLEQILVEKSITHVDGILLDLGLNSEQLESTGRGFSFQRRDEPLVMTFSRNPSEEEITAVEIVNDWQEESLADIIFGYGEEKFARRIAKGIVEARAQKKIETVGELVDVIKHAVPVWYRHRKTHCATKTFQALRMTVNNELGALKEVLGVGLDRLSAGGRLVVISFHSLEDKVVKNVFKEAAQESNGIILTKKPITPSEAEIADNPRSRSAKLRIFESS